MNIKTDLSENIFLSERRWGKTLMQEQQWANLKCNDCGGKLELEKDNEFESVKICPDCGSRSILIKKIREENELKGRVII